MKAIDIIGYIIITAIISSMALLIWAMCRTAGKYDDMEEEYWESRKEKEDE